MMSIDAILKNLPHRYPLLLVDKVITLTPGQSITAVKNVTINEPFFLGHFPGKPIMPGVLILEAMAQVVGLLALQDMSDRQDIVYLLGGVDKVRFKRLVVPGDQIWIQANVLRIKGNVWKCYAESQVSNELVCSAEILGMAKKM